MRATRFRDDLTVPVPRLATGYTPAPDGSWRRADITEETVGDGGVVTSVSDLAGWQQFMLTGATLGADTRDGLLEPAVLADGRRLPYALGLEIITVAGRRVYMHSGHIDGFRSALAYLIDGGMGVAVLANRDDTFPAEIAVRIAERLAGTGAPAPAARLGERAALAAQPAVTGRWYSPELDTHMVIGAAGDGTVTHVEGGSTSRYAAMSDGSWLGLGAPARSGSGWPAASCGWRMPSATNRPRSTCAGDPPAAARPTGTYYSEQLRVHATLAAADGAVPGAQPSRSGLPRRGPCHRCPTACGRATASPSGCSPAMRSWR